MSARERLEATFGVVPLWISRNDDGAGPVAMLVEAPDGARIVALVAAGSEGRVLVELGPGEAGALRDALRDVLARWLS